MALPFMPGNSFNPNLGKTKFHKSQHFGYNNDVSLLIGETKPGIGGERLPWQTAKPNHSAIPRGSGPDLPSWVAFDKQVLSFDAFFLEAVNERREEQYRVHKCKIFFYLEDDSIQVVEPKTDNSGLPQGTIIRRHRVTRPPPYDSQFYTVEDFNIGNELLMYARKFKIVDCDEFTGNFMRKLGVRLNPVQETPSDPFSEHRKTLGDSMQPLRPYEKRDTLKQFLDHDRHVLRMYCFWDDRDNAFGDPREMVLHYYLADDTIEVSEIIPGNSGRDAVPMFLHRGKLPKILEPLRRPGEIADRTVLNVFGPMGRGGRWILDSLKMGAVNQEFYTEGDLAIGAYINVWGRKFLICEYDEFTKEYYRTKYGINDFTPLRSRNADAAQQQGNTRQVPPYNGFGSEEDSLNSCLSLLPKPPKRDFIKFMAKDRLGFDSNVLRFVARLDTEKPTEIDRRFTISYFLADDTILIFEPPVKNSGGHGGKFLERSRVKKPNQPQYSTEMSQYYTGSDFYVGAAVEFNKHKFILLDADEYAYNYMENHSDEFPQSNMQLILQKLRQISSEVRLDHLAAETQMPFDGFQRLLQSIGQGRLSQQEILTVARYYQDRGGEKLNTDALIAIVQEQLKRATFEGFSLIEDNCLHFDRTRSGFLDQDRLRSIFRSMRVPVQDDVLRELLAQLTINEAGQVDYRSLIEVINWRRRPVAVPQTDLSNNDDTGRGEKTSTQLETVNIRALLQDLRGACTCNDQD